MNHFYRYYYYYDEVDDVEPTFTRARATLLPRGWPISSEDRVLMPSIPGIMMVMRAAPVL